MVDFHRRNRKLISWQEGDSAVDEFQSKARVVFKDVAKRGYGLLLEVRQSAVIAAELSTKRFPGDVYGFILLVHSIGAKGYPGIEVQRQR